MTLLLAHRKITTISVVALASLLAALLLFRWDGWSVNHDGGFYLALSKSISSGNGYRFPDSSFASFRGPLYPTFLSLPWLFFPPDAKTALWWSRTALIAGAGVVTWMGAQASRSRWLGLLAGSIVTTSPLWLVAGGTIFVPDALAMFFLLAAISLLLVSGRRSATSARLVTAGLVGGLSAITKETYTLALAVVIVLAVGIFGWTLRRAVTITVGWVVPWSLWATLAWAMAGELPPPVDSVNPVLLLGLWAAIAFAAAYLWRTSESMDRGSVPVGVWPLRLLTILTGLATTGVLWLASTPWIHPIPRMVENLRLDIHRQLFGQVSLWWLLPLPLIAVVWCLVRIRETTALTGLLLFSLGAGYLVHSSMSGIGLRNGLPAIYGLALMAGFTIKEATDRVRLAGIPMLAILLAFISVGVIGSEYVDEVSKSAPMGSDVESIRRAADWLEVHADGVVVGTPLHLSYMWFLATGSPEFRLVPMYSGRPSSVFPDQGKVEWAGFEWGPSGVESAPPLTVTVARRETTFTYPIPIRDELMRAGVRYLVLTGNAQNPGSALEGGVLLRDVIRQRGLVPVFVGVSSNPGPWALIYRIDRWENVEYEETLVYQVVDLTPLATYAPSQRVIDMDEYLDMVNRALEAADG